ncbi:MAG: DUF4339 domain-containing protein [Planctomycetaceae bacterium]|nr:DUF4339 domain-containing protein [Planctomycetaceae bacterium]
MSSRWHYRIEGRDLGPVEFATLQVMAAEERLFFDDEIRSEESDQWVSAETVPGLFPEAADEDDLSSMLGDPDTESVPQDRENGLEGCYCRTRTEELGPMSQGQLLRLARQGRLAPRDQVRLGANADWVEARSVPGLFAVPAPEKPNQATSEAAAMMDSFEIVADPTPRKPKAPRAAHQPAVQMEDDDSGPTSDDVIPISGKSQSLPASEARWHCRVLGQEIGPIGWDDLRELVETRQLGPNDRIRQESSADWVAASTIANLFKKRNPRAAKGKKKKLSEDEVFDMLQPKEPEPETRSHLAPQRSFEPFNRKSSPESPARATPAAGTGRPDSAETAAGGGASAPAAVAARPEPPAAAPAPRPAFTPPPPPPRPAPRPKRPMGNPFAGVGAKIGGMFGSLGGGGGGGLASHWKPIVGVVVVLAIVGVLSTTGIPKFGNPGTKYYEETKPIWEEAQKIKNSGTADEWSKFSAAKLPRVKELAAELDPLASANERLCQLMLFCHRDCLPVLMAGNKDANGPIWKEMTGYMKEAEQIVTAK